MNVIARARWFVVKNTLFKAEYSALVDNFPVLQQNFTTHQAWMAQFYRAIMRPGYNPPAAVVAAYAEGVSILNRWNTQQEQIVAKLREAALAAIDAGEMTPAQARSAGLGLLQLAGIAVILAIGLLVIGAQAVFMWMRNADTDNKRMWEIRRQYADAVIAGDIKPDDVPDSAQPRPDPGSNIGTQIGAAGLGIAAVLAVLFLGPTFFRSLR